MALFQREARWATRFLRLVGSKTAYHSLTSMSCGSNCTLFCLAVLSSPYSWSTFAAPAGYWTFRSPYPAGELLPTPVDIRIYTSISAQFHLNIDQPIAQTSGNQLYQSSFSALSSRVPSQPSDQSRTPIHLDWKTVRIECAHPRIGSISLPTV